MNTPQIIIEWSSCPVCRDSYPFCDLLEGQRGAYCCEACMECAGDLPKPTVQAMLTPAPAAKIAIHVTNQQRRAGTLNIVANAVFSGGIDESEYDALVEAANYCACAWCSNRFRRTLHFYSGPTTGRGNKYCSAHCVEQAEREHAPLRKPQTAGLVIEGWDL